MNTPEPRRVRTAPQAVRPAAEIVKQQPARDQRRHARDDREHHSGQRPVAHELAQPGDHQRVQRGMELAQQRLAVEKALRFRYVPPMKSVSTP